MAGIDNTNQFPNSKMATAGRLGVSKFRSFTPDNTNLFPNSKEAAAAKLGVSYFRSVDGGGGAVVGVPPVNSALPVISGTPQVGQTLTTSNGTWSGATAPYTYQWKRGGANIVGATMSSYVLITADVGGMITAEVTAINATGNATALSVAVGPVAVANVAPSNSVLPVINGFQVVDATLTTTTGTWSGIPTPTFTYQWKRDGANITGSTATTYLLVTADIGTMISVTVTATNAAGSAAATASAVGFITSDPTGGVTPPTIDLVAIYDAGSSSTDNITNYNTPAFDIFCTRAPAVGDVIDIAKDGLIVSSITLTDSDIAGTTVPGLGVTALPDGTYVFTARHTNAGATSNYSSGLTVVIDTVLPILTAASGTQNGTNQYNADLSVTTNIGEGIIYWVVQPAAMSAPTPVQIIGGVGSDGLYPPSGQSGFSTVSTSGAKSFTATGFSTTGSYKVHFTQTDTAGNNAAVPTVSAWMQTITAFTAQGIGGFDGSTTYLTNTALASSIPAGKQGLLSFWVKMATGLGTDRFLFALTTGGTVRLWCHWLTSNTIELKGRNNASADILSLQTTTPNPFATLPTGWIHVAAWWDLAAATPAGQLYVNGTLLTGGTKTLTNDLIGYNTTTLNIGANQSAGSKMNGSLSELYLNLHETRDLSVAANLQKFRDSGGNPISLGANGSTPTGTQPEFYLGGANNNTNWQNNLGSKGNFTIPAGALTSVTGPP